MHHLLHLHQRHHHPLGKVHHHRLPVHLLEMLLLNTPLLDLPHLLTQKLMQLIGESFKPS